jgi:hypothetical protein
MKIAAFFGFKLEFVAFFSVNFIYQIYAERFEGKYCLKHASETAKCVVFTRETRQKQTPP